MSLLAWTVGPSIPGNVYDTLSPPQDLSFEKSFEKEVVETTSFMLIQSYFNTLAFKEQSFQIKVE